MDAILIVLFIVSCALAGLGALVTYLLSPEPKATFDHLSSLGRLMVVAGAAFSICRAGWDGMTPQPEVVVFAVGIALLTCLYAWRNYRAALLSEGGNEWWEPIRTVFERLGLAKRPPADVTDEQSGT